MAKGGAKRNIGDFNTFFMDVLEISSYWHNNRLEADYSSMELPIVLANLLELKELITASRSKSKNSLPLKIEEAIMAIDRDPHESLSCV